MTRLIFLFISVCLFTSTLSAQVLKGIITDSERNPVSFATVFVKESSFGTSANEEGAFELRLTEGTYTFIFQCMGYQTVTKTVKVLPTNEPITIVLPAMVYSLKEVVVSDGGEDPAYRIMRRVIRKAPLYAGMVKSYNADVYIRGSLNIRKISSMVKWMARDDLKESNIKEGDTYIEESVNEIQFTAPNLTRQKVKSIHSTFPGGNEDRSAGAIGFISGNIYRPDAFGNARSPIASGAFNYYKFRYEGVNTYGDIAVYKIRIIPRGDGPQYVKGYLYVIEGLWCLYNLDITINEQLGMTVQLTQSFGEVRDGAWLPVNNRFKIDMDLMGNVGGFLYSTSIKYNQLVVNPPDIKSVKPTDQQVKNQVPARKKTQAKSAKLDKKASELMAIENPTTAESYRLAEVISRKAELERKDSLRNNHEFVETYKTVFDSNARKTDSAFWNKVRPIPLAANELKSVQSFDSIQYKQNLQASDSIKANKPKHKRLTGILLTGGRFEPDTLQSFQCDGLLNPFALSFNTVDGFVYKMGLGWERKINKKSVLSVDFKPGYAFSRKAFLWDAGVGFKREGKYTNTFSLQFGSNSRDYNLTGSAASIENSVSSLFFRQNLMRLYRSDYIGLKHSINLDAGLILKSSFIIADNRQLDNNSDFSFFYTDSREYSPNIPDNPDFLMEDHRDAKLEISISYQPMPYYYIKNGKKVPRPGMNNTPVFSFNYNKAIPFEDLDTDFDLMTIGMNQKVNTGKKSNIEYSFAAGYFLNNKKVYFDDFRHFSTQPLLVGVKEFYPTIQMGDYYRYSTDSYFADAHFIYTSPMLLLKRLPLIRNRMWNESLFMNYIYVPDYKHSVEVGYGIGNYLYNIGVFAGFEKGSFRSAGFRVALSVFSKREIVVGM